MARVLTGIQSSGRPHLGNILGAIVPAIQLIEQNSKEESFIFIADFHSLTSQKDGKMKKKIKIQKEQKNFQSFLKRKLNLLN